MAIWQFSLFLVPTDSIKERLGETPSKLSMDVAEDTPWWSGHQPKNGFEDAISEIFPESPSWSESLRIWGAERSNSILVGYRTDERTEVEQIEIRIDLSNFPKEFVRHACVWATELDCLAWTKAYDVVRPDYEEVIEAIKKSRAMKFMLDPAKTLQSLKSEEFEQRS